MAEHENEIIGNWQLAEPIGNGGMGVVYRATHRFLEREAAVKVLHPHLANDAMFRARFLQEARAVSRLDHPHVLSLLDFGADDDRHYLVMPLLPDGTLRTLLRQRDSADSPWSLALGLELVRQAAEGLAYAHAADMVHRDIKPDNLLLRAVDPTDDPEDAPPWPWTLCVGDFGLARLADGSHLTASGITMGTPAYMSPEQCQGLDIDGRCDVYALGVVLYEVVTGRVPFPARTLSEAVYQHVFTPPTPPRLSQPELPPGLEDLILRCLAKSPDARVPSMEALESELRSVLASLPGDAATTIPTGPVLADAASPAIIERDRETDIMTPDPDQEKNQHEKTPHADADEGPSQDADREPAEIASVADLAAGEELLPISMTPPVPLPPLAAIDLDHAPVGDDEGEHDLPSEPETVDSGTGEDVDVDISLHTDSGTDTGTETEAAVVSEDGVEDDVADDVAVAAVEDVAADPELITDDSDVDDQVASVVAIDDSEQMNSDPVDDDAAETNADEDAIGDDIDQDSTDDVLDVVDPADADEDVVDDDGDQAIADNEVEPSAVDQAPVDDAVVLSGAGDHVVNDAVAHVQVDDPLAASAAVGVGVGVAATMDDGDQAVVAAADADEDESGDDPAQALPRVVVIAGDGQVVAAGDLTGDSLRVGRLSTNALVLPQQGVSRNHARIDWDGEQATITDLGSRNGTMLGDARLTPFVAHVWPATTPLRIGPLHVRLILPGAALAVPATAAATVPASVSSESIDSEPVVRDVASDAPHAAAETPTAAQVPAPAAPEDSMQPPPPVWLNDAAYDADDADDSGWEQVQPLSQAAAVDEVDHADVDYAVASDVDVADEDVMDEVVMDDGSEHDAADDDALHEDWQVEQASAAFEEQRGTIEASLPSHSAPVPVAPTPRVAEVSTPPATREPRASRLRLPLLLFLLTLLVSAVIFGVLYLVDRGL